MTSTKLDIRRLVARFGGQSELYRRLTSRGVALSAKAIEKWIERDNIPSARLVQLFELAIAEGHPIDLNTFMLRPNTSTQLSPQNRHEKNQADHAG